MERAVLEVRRGTELLEDPLRALAQPELEALEAPTQRALRQACHRVAGINAAVRDQEALIDRLLSANLAQVNARQTAISLRQNADMRTIAAWAAIVALPAAAAGVYGMNFDHLPGQEWEHGFLVSLAVIAVFSLAVYYRFKRSGWL